MTSATSQVAAGPVDRFASARLVADAVLYEGYVLYPYRASAQKNQLRWQFGVLTPRDHALSCGSERSSMRSEVIVDPGDQPMLTVRIRCLQVQHRDVEASSDEGVTFAPVSSLHVGANLVVPWDEAVEHEIDVAALALLPLAEAAKEHSFTLDAGDSVEVLRGSVGETIGRAIRRCEHVAGVVRITTSWADGDGALLKVSITIENTTDWHETGADRETAMLRSLIAVHTLLAVDDGSFVSLLEPEPFAEQAVAGCTSDGTFPVLIGNEGNGGVMLSSPIILYDFPAIAPESAGDFCDATEIDEILALRVLTLTDEEKAEARGTDPRAAAIIDRCDEMPDEIWSRLHGALRSLSPAGPAPAMFDLEAADSADAGDVDLASPSVPWWDPGTDAAFDPFTDTMRIGGAEVTCGTRVRLSPSRRADAHDLFYRGQLATVKGVFNDVDGNQHVAVVLEDDPASDMLEWQGRFLYFHPEEIEVLT